jgi:polyphosphate kinase
VNFNIIEKINNKDGNEKYPYKERLLSILEFNFRVLELSNDKNIPVIERLKFIEIVFNNIDEFISIRLSECKEKDKLYYLSIIKNIYHMMDESYESIINQDLIISTDINNDIKSSYFIDGGIYYVYIDIGDNFNIVPLVISPSVTEERIKVLNPNIEIKYSFLIRFVSDKTFKYIYTGESTLEILNEIKSLIKLKNDSVFNYIQSTCDSPYIMNEFFSQMSISLDSYIYVSENIICIKEIVKNIIKSNTDSSLYYPKYNPTYNKLNYINELVYRDIMIHNPYESYTHVTDFVNEMCVSKNIKTIFCTLYRAAENSSIVDSLVEAKKSNKNVYVYVELTARGDEKNNVDLIERLLKYNINVTCNYFNYKVHSKIFCAIDNNGIIYSHIGTGNYNENTAKVYTDLHLLTTNPSISVEILKVFMCVLKKKIYFPEDSIVRKKLFASPINLREEIIRCIDRETRKKDRGRIYIKCNSLSDLQVINKLYKAAKNGVDIKIIARSAISILPIYKNIQIRSKVGRYLEHDRIYIFGNDVYISSADLMLRNINKRVEVLCNITDDNCRMKIFDIFNNIWTDEDIHFIGKNYKWFKI